MFELWAEMRDDPAGISAGAVITAAGKKIEDLVADWGFECDKMGHDGYRISYGMPLYYRRSHERDYMEWTILTNEVYTVHPMIRCRGYAPPFTMIGDMYFIGQERTEIMTTTLPGLPEMIPY